jgi:hypothetical protein
VVAVNRDAAVLFGSDRATQPWLGEALVTAGQLPCQADYSGTVVWLAAPICAAPYRGPAGQCEVKETAYYVWGGARTSIQHGARSALPILM